MAENTIVFYGVLSCKSFFKAFLELGAGMWKSCFAGYINAYPDERYQVSNSQSKKYLF